LWEKQETKAIMQYESVDKDTDENLYQRGYTTDSNEYIELLMACPVFNLSSPHVFRTSLRLHRMPIGSYMLRHNDGQYHYAVTTYLNECEGGIFVAEHPVSGKKVYIPPKKNRTLIMDCGVQHWVTEVTKGERLSLQTFIKVEHINHEPPPPKE
jgi:hypothetical protein